MFFYWLTKFIFKIFARIFFQLKFEGLQNLPKGRGYILVANHASSLDPFMIIAAVPRYIRWLVIYEYYDQWLFRWILTRMHFIRVENNLPKEAFRALLRKEVVGIFPEGRRTWNGQLGQAKGGAAALARKTSCPVVPVAILGTFAALPRTRRLMKPHPVTVRIGAPLYFRGLKPEPFKARIINDRLSISLQKPRGLKPQGASFFSEVEAKEDSKSLDEENARRIMQAITELLRG